MTTKHDEVDWMVPFKEEDFKLLHGHEMLWSEDDTHCDAIERSEYAAMLANRRFRELIKDAPEVFGQKTQ